MHFICSSRLKNVAPSSQQLKQLAEMLRLSSSDIAHFNGITPFQHEQHVTASECFRTWFSALSQLRQNQCIDYKLDHRFTIKDVSVRFTRFENQVFVYFLIQSENFPANETELIHERDELQRMLLQHYAEELDFDFHVTSKIVEYRELLRLQAVAPLYIAGEEIPADIKQAYLNQVDGKDYKRYYRVCYANEYCRTITDNGNSPFVREQSSIIILNDGASIIDGELPSTERNHLYNMLHTELVFFHRTQAMEERLSPTYKRIDLLKDMVHVLEDQWIRIRTYFSIAPKFALVRGSKAAHLFFNLLEVNGQVLALQNSIISRMDREHGKMQERYERLHFNAIQEGTQQEQEFFQQTHKAVAHSFIAYHKNTATLKDAISRLNEGVSQLRDDFDSNTNIILQLLVFVLSIVLVIWGVITLGFDKGFSIIGQTPLDILSLLSIIMGCLVGVSGMFWLGAKVFVNNATKVLHQSANQVIQTSLENDGNANKQVVEKVEHYLVQLKQDRSRRKKVKDSAYMHRINQLLEVLIMLLPAVSLRQLDVKRATEYMKSAGDILKIEIKDE